MKKTIFTLLILLVCVIQSTMAYEYFTIYFSDGTKSEAFYATDVDSICYSMIGLDSIAYDDWQVQEIYTIDSVYRYPLAQIDSLSFKDVDENEIAQRICNVVEEITPIFVQTNSTMEVLSHLSTIKKLEEVEDAWIDNQTLYVKIKDSGTLTYLYPPEDLPIEGLFAEESSVKTRSTKAYAPTNNSSQFSTIDTQKACIINQQSRDESRSKRKTVCNDLLKLCREWGLDTITINRPLPSFFEKEIFDYDIIMMITHGHYDERTDLHWLTTGEQIFVAQKNEIVNTNSIKEWINKKYFKKYSSNDIFFTCIKEKRNGQDSIPVYYTQISEQFISKQKNSFRNANNAIVFNTACQSLKKNNNLAKAFGKLGAISYLGYNEVNGIGIGGGAEFITFLLNGKATDNAVSFIDSKWKEQTIEYPAKSGKKVSPHLRHIRNESVGICRPTTLNTDIEGFSIMLNASVKILNPYGKYAKTNMYGFLISDNPQMNNYGYYNATEFNFNTTNKVYSFCSILSFNNPEPNKTYYYCSFLFDGKDYCFGEIKSFTTPDFNNSDTPDENAEPYYVWDDANKIATYYYDAKRKSRNGRIFRESYNFSYMVPNPSTKVVFDKSFSFYYPKRFSFDECSELQSIENIQYLNTNALTSGCLMFSGCSSLTSLDLSNFNTANMTDFSDLFAGCSSLTSLDLSNFDTSNVMGMVDMFAGCSSLTSLDLSNFDTSKVQYMEGMFAHCSSLTNLDLSSFDTSNVMNMSGMFQCCESLTSLDLSSFDTSNVTNMSDMFWRCISLTSLDLSSFEISNVTSTGSMFSGCISLKTIYAGNWPNNSNWYNPMFSYCTNLVGGMGTKIGKNLYGYDKNGNPLYYSCPDDATAAHVDGGKDNPGLFTTK